MRTKLAPTRPWAVMKLFFAIRHRIPIIPCVPKALATIMSRLRSGSDARWINRSPWLRLFRDSGPAVTCGTSRSLSWRRSKIQCRCHTRVNHRRPGQIQRAGIIANSWCVRAPGQYGAPPRKCTTVSLVYHCVPKVLSAIIRGSGPAVTRGTDRSLSWR